MTNNNLETITRKEEIDQFKNSKYSNNKSRNTTNSYEIYTKIYRTTSNITFIGEQSESST